MDKGFSDEDLAFAPVVRQVGLLRHGVVSAIALTEIYLERIARLDRTLVRTTPAGNQGRTASPSPDGGSRRVDVGQVRTDQPHVGEPRIGLMRLGRPWNREVVPGVVRLGTPFVGFYAVEDAGAYILIDSGLPGYWNQIAAFLAARHAPMSAIEAVVLTHCHDDHKGNAERLREREAIRVLVHPADLAATVSKGKIPKIPLWRHRVLHYGLHVLRAGAARVPPVLEAATFDDGDVLDLPGRPRVIHTPGHTPGNVALHLADREVLVVGDALATLDLVSGETGPRLLPPFFNADNDQALASLQNIERASARWILPGHGLPWQGSPSDAVASARKVARRTP